MFLCETSDESSWEYVTLQALKFEERSKRLENELHTYRGEHNHSDQEFIEKEERITQLEYTLDETQNELHNKLRVLSDHQDQLNELKVDFAGVREQKNAALKEVGNRF